jgi:hypothetical protein
MSPRANFSPSRWSPVYFNQGEEASTSECPKAEPLDHNGSDARNFVCHNTAVDSQTKVAFKTISETSIPRRLDSSSPSLSNSGSHNHSHRRGRSRSRSREGRRDSETIGGGWDRRFHESPPTLNSRRTAAGRQLLADNRPHAQNNSNSASNSHHCDRVRELAKDDRCKNVTSFTEFREHSGWQRGRSAERQNFDLKSATAQSPSQKGWRRIVCQP